MTPHASPPRRTHTPNLPHISRFGVLVLALFCASSCDFRDLPPETTKPANTKPSNLKEIKLPSPKDYLTLPGKVILRESFSTGTIDTKLWNNTIAPGGQGSWEIRDGQLFSPGTRNAALWLKTPLPDKVRIEFTARSLSKHGDIKAEVFGDGQRHESGYILLFGGWKNTINAIARLDEHGTDRCQHTNPTTVCRVDAAKNLRVTKNRTHRLAIVRVDHVLRWYVDGQLFLSYADPNPLVGPNHDHFGFNDWAVPLYFDNLVVTDLTQSKLPQ